MSESNSTRAATSSKGCKLRLGFPHFQHSIGRWATKIRGKRHCVGKADGVPDHSADRKRILAVRAEAQSRLTVPVLGGPRCCSGPVSGMCG